MQPIAISAASICPLVADCQNAALHVLHQRVLEAVNVLRARIGAAAKARVHPFPWSRELLVVIDKGRRITYHRVRIRETGIPVRSFRFPPRT